MCCAVHVNLMICTFCWQGRVQSAVSDTSCQQLTIHSTADSMISYQELTVHAIQSSAFNSWPSVHSTTALDSWPVISLDEGGGGEAESSEEEGDQEEGDDGRVGSRARRARLRLGVVAARLVARAGTINWNKEKQYY